MQNLSELSDQESLWGFECRIASKFPAQVAEAIHYEIEILRRMKQNKDTDNGRD